MVNLVVEINGKRYEGRPFPDSKVEIALENSQSDNYRPLFMPELADQRIKEGKESVLWQRGYTTPSLKATGITNQGSRVVVYRHKENHLSNPNNITEAKKQGLVKYAARIPQIEFQKYVDEDGIKDDKGNRLVWVIPYETLRKASSKLIPVDSAIDHPQTIPFLGGEERAIAYLRKHKKVFGDKIGNWNSDDLSDEALGRLLCLSYDCSGGLYGDDLDYGGCFFGVRLVNAEGASAKIAKQQKSPTQKQETSEQKVQIPSLEQMLSLSPHFAVKYVPLKSRKAFEREFREIVEKLYRR